MRRPEEVKGEGVRMSENVRMNGENELPRASGRGKEKGKYPLGEKRVACSV